MTIRHRDVAQLGSALPWGGRGRQFKSDRSDQYKINEILSRFYYKCSVKENTFYLYFDKAH